MNLDEFVMRSAAINNDLKVAENNVELSSAGYIYALNAIGSSLLLIAQIGQEILMEMKKQNHSGRSR